MNDKSESYRPATCCPGHDCDYAFEATEDQPCWGPVEVTDEVQVGEDDYAWVHACQGHAKFHDKLPYIPEP